MKKKILSLICCFALIFVCLLTVAGCEEAPAVSNIWDGSRVNVSKANKENIIKIETAEELAGFAKSVNEGNTYEGITILLTRDLNLNNLEWTPIGFGSSTGLGDLDTEDSHYFKGIFDGGNHTIKNLKITTFTGGGFSDPAAATGVGLFGHTYNATIKNLTVENANVVGNHFVAVVAGFSYGTAIENVHVKNANVNCVFLDTNDSGDKAAAIAGFIGNSKINSAFVKGCSAMDSKIYADRDGGQLIGCFYLWEVDGTQPSCIEENNNAVDVTVEWNGTGAVQGSSSTNIANAHIGRDER